MEERERKQNKTKRKKASRFNNRVIALFRITICQRSLNFMTPDDKLIGQKPHRVCVKQRP